MRAIPGDHKVTVADQATSRGEPSPNPRGWYHSVGGVVATKTGLVCVYRRSDAHCAVFTDLMVCYSTDGGRTWTGHHPIARSNVWEDRAVWIAPQLSRLRDGRLVVLCDRGQRGCQQDWPMLTDWQRRPPRGMSNHLLWSHDDGRTWSDPVQLDDIGGEPGYLAELHDGTLVYTRTESRLTAELFDPPQPWGNRYYRNVATFLRSDGKTWDRESILSDDPYHGDCEVGLVELEPDHLLAITRIGYAGGADGQPGRFIHSYDGGRTWDRPRLSPIYPQRPILRKLASGKLLLTYGERHGVHGNCAVMLAPDETPAYEPQAILTDESRCELLDGALRLTTGDGRGELVEFALYPAFDDWSAVELTAELRLERGTCRILAGCEVRFEAGRVCLAKRPADGFELDTSGWHTYRIVRSVGCLSVAVDGVERLNVAAGDARTRRIRFGAERQGVSHWRSVSARINNAVAPSVDWSWSATDGYPDPFRRERVVLLDRSPDTGYGGWAQLDDGSIVIVDYTNESLETASFQGGRQTILRAYLTDEDFLAGQRT